jgi:MFS family permease
MSGRGLRVFRLRNYRLFFGGQVISLIGTWMQQVAQAWLVLELTGDPFMLGLVAAAQYLPVMALGLFGGLIADQLPKRRTLLATQAVSMVLAFVLFGLTVSGLIEVWHVLLLALLLGAANSIEMPTRQSFIAEMVGRENIRTAVGLNSAVFNSARVVGPAIAGLTIGLLNISAAFLVNGLTFLAVIIGLLLMRESELHRLPAPQRPDGLREVGESLAEGLSFVRGQRTVLATIVAVSVVGIFGLNFTVLVPPLAKEVLGSDAMGFGFLMTATGVGSVMAALAVAFARRSRPSYIAGGAIVLGLASIVLALSRDFTLSMVALFAIGAGSIAMGATANTVIQMAAPDRLRGRVLSIYVTTYVGTMPIGSVLAGWVASQWGAPLALGLGGAVCMAVGLAARGWLSSPAQEPAGVLPPGRPGRPAPPPVTAGARDGGAPASVSGSG